MMRDKAGIGFGPSIGNILERLEKCRNGAVPGLFMMLAEKAGEFLGQGVPPRKLLGWIYELFILGFTSEAQRDMLYGLADPEGRWAGEEDLGWEPGSPNPLAEIATAWHGAGRPHNEREARDAGR